MAALRSPAAFAFILALVMGIGPFAVVGINALSPLVVPALGLTRTQLGSLTTVAFAVAGVCSVLAGRQVDRFGGRPMLIAGFACGGAAAAAMAASTSLTGLWLGAVLAGFALALGNPVTNQLIADHITPGRRGLQIGLKQSGVPMSQGFVGIALPSLAVLVGWRSAVGLGIAVALSGAALGLWIVPRGAAPSSTSQGTPKQPIEQAVWRLTAYSFVIGIGVQPVLVYAPLYAYERVGFTPVVSGMALGAIGAAGIVGRILWAQIAERIDDAKRALVMVSTIATTSALLVLAAEFVGAWAFWAGMIGFGASALAANSVVMFAVVGDAREGGTGRATGVVSGGIFLGFMVGPVLFGALADATDAYVGGWATVTALFFSTLIMTLVWRRTDRRAIKRSTGGGPPSQVPRTPG